MADQLENRPVFTVVLGCAGAGKTAWKRENRDRLPNHYFDCHSFAGGVGDWDTETAKAMARRYVDEEIAKAIEARLDFGVESTCPEGPGRELVERTKRAGYRVEGVYIGTDSPAINVERVEHRVASYTGHRADVAKLADDHAVSLSDLREILDWFDELEIIDNSEHDAGRRPPPRRPDLHGEGRRDLGGGDAQAVVRGVARPLMAVCRYRVGAGSGCGCAASAASGGVWAAADRGTDVAAGGWYGWTVDGQRCLSGTACADAMVRAFTTQSSWTIPPSFNCTPNIGFRRSVLP